MDCAKLVPSFMTIDLESAGMLPPNWLAETAVCIEQFAIAAVLQGGSSTSLEEPGTDIEYKLVTGDVIEKVLPWLHELYHHDLLDLAKEAAGRDIRAAESVMSGININILEGEGSRYEWHTDSNSITCVLFASTQQENAGGALTFKVGDSQCRLHPHAGQAAFFDARRAPHAVEPLRGDTQRIAIPMNYYGPSEEQQRPEELDRYLYETESKRAIDGG